MDIISQLQEQVNSIANLALNTVGTLQRDAPPNRLSQSYPEPPAHPTEDGANFSEQPKSMSAALVKAAKQFDALVAALPISETGEEAQLKRIAELQAENDAVGQELQKQLEAAEKELNQVQELFKQASDNCLNLKKPDVNSINYSCSELVWRRIRATSFYLILIRIRARCRRIFLFR